MNTYELRLLARWLTIISLGVILSFYNSCGGGSEGTGIIDQGPSSSTEDTICGTITDLSGEGQADVTISASSGDSVLSDQDGSFIVTIHPDQSGQAQLAIAHPANPSEAGLTVHVGETAVFLLPAAQVRVNSCDEEAEVTD